MEPIHWLLSSGTGVAVGLAAVGVADFVRWRRAKPKRVTFVDCEGLHRTAAAEMTIYNGKIVSPDAAEHAEVCTRYEVVLDPNDGWRVVATPVGAPPRVEFLCEHVWINPGGMSAEVCGKCGIPKTEAYRRPTIVQGPYKNMPHHKRRTA